MKILHRRRVLVRLGSALTGMALVVVVTALPAAADATLTPSSGPPGSRVTASGSSTKPAGASCKTVDVYFGATKHSDGHVVDKGTKVASGTCAAAGKYSVPFTVPGNATKGQKQVLVAGNDAKGQSVTEETAIFTVT